MVKPYIKDISYMKTTTNSSIQKTPRESPRGQYNQMREMISAAKAQ